MECSYCGTSFKDAQKKSDTDNGKYFFETQFSGMDCCQNEECVYTYIMEHNQYDENGESMS